MTDLALADLVANRTMSPEMAATLATAAAERRSTLAVAIPRGAGKSTVTQAMLAYAPSGTAFHQLSEEHGPGLGIPDSADGGYLLMSEVSQAPMLDYLWGDPVRHVFASLHARDFALATALHAPGLDEAIEIICGQNGVPNAHASDLDLVFYLRSFCDDWRNPERRVLASLYELDRVERGRPHTRLLHRWREAPKFIGQGSGAFASHLATFPGARTLDLPVLVLGTRLLWPPAQGPGVAESPAVGPPKDEDRFEDVEVCGFVRTGPLPCLGSKGERHRPPAVGDLGGPGLGTGRGGHPRARRQPSTWTPRSRRRTISRRVAGRLHHWHNSLRPLPSFPSLNPGKEGVA